MDIDLESKFILNSNEVDLKYPTPLSLLWRSIHVTLYLIGGIGFVLGSAMYFPSISQATAGGWLFTIGSLGFFIADGLEWSTNNHVGCLFDRRYVNQYEKMVNPFLAPKDSFYGKYQRAENGINFFVSFIGSTLYLVGSIMYIPSVDEVVAGTYVFILGSAVIFFAQSWKLYRAGCHNAEAPSDIRFNIKNCFDDLPGTLVDLTAGLGGFCYFVGSFFFLPDYDINDTVTTIGATWFEFGGSFYLLSGLFMVYRYFCTQNYPH